MRAVRLTLRSLGGVIGAYLLIAVLMVIVVDIALGGVTYEESTAFALALAALSSLVSAVLAGYLGARIAGRAPRWHALAMISIVAFDTTWIVVKGITTDPLWVTVASGTALAAGLAVGAEICARRRRVAPDLEAA